MPNRYFNWHFEEVVSFLKKEGFVHLRTNGSHHNYYKSGRMVTIQFHAGRVIKPRTIKSIILQSGIPKEKWFE